MKLQQLFADSPTVWAELNPPEPVNYQPLQQLGINLFIKREDRLHSALSGNKLYKLHGHLQAARSMGTSRLLSFGGYYSNHLHALSATGAALGFGTTGVVRGHHPKTLSPTLRDCLDWGMHLIFVSRLEYAQKNDPGWLNEFLCENTGADDIYVIPEGGQSRVGTVGCGAIIAAARKQLDLQRTLICVPSGTGTTLAGILGSAKKGERILGFPALKLGSRAHEYKASIETMLVGQTVAAGWDVNDQFHCGGFAKTTPRYLQFLQHFEEQTAIPLDPVYTGKMLFGIVQLARSGYWQRGQQILAIHTGGLQGKRKMSSDQNNNLQGVRT